VCIRVRHFGDFARKWRVQGAECEFFQAKFSEDPGHGDGTSQHEDTKLAKGGFAEITKIAEIAERRFEVVFFAFSVISVISAHLPSFK
jgi:hypothetical protein